MDEIIVTARKREEFLQEVPISITSFSASELQTPTLQNISDLSDFTPNMEFNFTTAFSGSSNAATVFIRGVGQNDFLMTTDPAVGIYLDGVYISRSMGGVLDLANLKQINILRGPQGTVFGKNTVGGAIQLISQRPSDQFGGDIEMTFGEFDRLDGQASLNLPIISDTLNTRVTIASKRRNGYAKRLLDGGELGSHDRLLGQLMVDWKIKEELNFLLSVDSTKQRQTSVPQTILEMVPSTIPKDLFNQLVAPQFNTQWDERWITGNPYTTYQTGPNRDDLDILGVSSNLSWQSKAFNLDAITAYRKLKATYSRDPDNSPLQYGHSTNRDQHYQISQELRLTGTAWQDKLDWLAGLYYFYEKGDNRAEILLFSGLFQATGMGALDFDFDLHNQVAADSYAAFAQINYHLSDQLRLTTGARLTREQKRFEFNSYKINSSVVIMPPTRVDESWSNISPMVSLSYLWDENHIGYFSISRGFKGGGFNGRQIITGTVEAFDPEYSTAYEIGLKSLWPRQNIRANLAFFYTQYKDMQFTILTTDNQGFEIPIIDNAARALIQGVELELTTTLIDKLNVNIGIGYTDGEYTSIDKGALITKQNELVKTPLWNVSAGLHYSTPFFDLGELGFEFNASYKSKEHYDVLNTESLIQEGCTLLNTHMSFKSHDQRWNAALFATNLTDKTYLEGGAADLVAFGGAEGYFAPPREWGLEIRYSY